MDVAESPTSGCAAFPYSSRLSQLSSPFVTCEPLPLYLCYPNKSHIPATAKTLMLVTPILLAALVSVVITVGLVSGCAVSVEAVVAAIVLLLAAK